MGKEQETLGFCLLFLSLSPATWYLHCAGRVCRCCKSCPSSALLFSHLQSCAFTSHYWNCSCPAHEECNTNGCVKLNKWHFLTMKCLYVVSAIENTFVVLATNLALGGKVTWGVHAELVQVCNWKPRAFKMLNIMFVQRTCLSSNVCHGRISSEISDHIIAAFISQAPDAANFSSPLVVIKSCLHQWLENWASSRTTWSGFVSSRLLIKVIWDFWTREMYYDCHIDCWIILKA